MIFDDYDIYTGGERFAFCDGIGGAEKMRK